MFGVKFENNNNNNDDDDDNNNNKTKKKRNTKSGEISGSKMGGSEIVGHEKGPCHSCCGGCPWFCHKLSKWIEGG